MLQVWETWTLPEELPPTRTNEQDRQEERDSMEINGEQAAKRDSTPSVSNDMAGVEKLSDGKSSDSSDTLIEVQEAQEANNIAAAATTPPPPPDIDIVKVNKQTEEVGSSKAQSAQPELNRTRTNRRHKHRNSLRTRTTQKRRWKPHRTTNASPCHPQTHEPSLGQVSKAPEIA